MRLLCCCGSQVQSVKSNDLPSEARLTDASGIRLCPRAGPKAGDVVQRDLPGQSTFPQQRPPLRFARREQLLLLRRRCCCLRLPKDERLLGWNGGGGGRHPLNDELSKAGSPFPQCCGSLGSALLAREEEERAQATGWRPPFPDWLPLMLPSFLLGCAPHHPPNSSPGTGLFWPPPPHPPRTAPGGRLVPRAPSGGDLTLPLSQVSDSQPGSSSSKLPIQFRNASESWGRRKLPLIHKGEE